MKIINYISLGLLFLLAGMTFSRAKAQASGWKTDDQAIHAYEDYIRQRLFAPLDMHNSFVSQEEAMRHGIGAGVSLVIWIPCPVHRAL